MALDSRLIQRIASRRDLLLALAICSAVLVVMGVLTLAFGVIDGGPSYELVADPGAGLAY